MITTVEGFRAFDVRGSFTSFSEEQIAAELQHAEDLINGMWEGRGYGPETLRNNTAYIRSVFKISRVELLANRGGAPNPNHDLLQQAADRAMAWVYRVAKGQDNLSSPASPRLPTGTASVITTDDDYLPPTRGW